MRCAILQPSYIPWRGYFHQIQKSDVFVFYDDVQYDKHGWRNRNRIKTRNGTQWLTIPVLSKGNVVGRRPILEVEINSGTAWARKHWQALKHSYGKAPYWSRYVPLLERMYVEPPERLADFTIATTKAIAEALGLSRSYVRSSALQSRGQRTGRLISILREIGADHYVSGPSARAYLNETELREAGVHLEYMEYEYPEYAQLYPPFDGSVSILDLLFVAGPDAGRYIWGASG